MKKEYHTKIYQKITEFVNTEKEGSFDAQEVYDYLNAQEIRANLVTIYRNLDKMVDNNMIVKFKSSKSTSMLYRVVDQKANCHRHLHLQCRTCGKIYHLDGEIMEQIDNYIKNHYNFDIDCQNSMLTGICAECQKKQK